ncbi:Disease resistance protein RPM1 [Dichanthelium oligosanthes]|uniref:Disease resistance protein RPM1 n=1 Tax=Dichanthelium oligosanthes TaxID=888268 RepID=A0A1E5VBV8_9POAL|nr:Disease resistance protein RPM1 [Dichanthelium oligosanthes]
MAEALILVLLTKIASILGSSALKATSTQLGKEASILFDVENSMKEIESEFDVMQAFISQVDPNSTNNQIFESWLKHIRKIAFEVEDIIDEYAFLLRKMDSSESSLGKVFHVSKNLKTWYTISSHLRQVKARLQSLTMMKERYGIKIVSDDENSSSKNISHRYLSDSSYLTDDDATVGHKVQAQRLTECIDDECIDRTVISILGMGGSGKTTLASSIYRKQDIIKNFQCHVWISVSPNYQVEDLLRRIIKQLLGSSDENNTSNPRDMVNQIQSYLTNKRYLIVLDDIWDRDSWMLFDHAFTKNKLRSRVVITTRTEGVASLAQENNIVRLGILTLDESRELFYKKAFSNLSEATCPKSLIPWANKILEKCQGLPLAIVAIGSLLSCRDMEEQEWRSFYNQLNWQLTHNPELSWVSSVLNLSLNDLPAHLKNCFLYCGLFPEDFRIRRKWIMRLWIAEGFVEDRGAETTPEEVAEDYIKELTQRSLIQVVERNEFGRPKRFQVHDLVREITISISRKEKFALICNHPDVTNLGDAARRVAVHSGGQVFEPGSTSQQLRSFLLFDKHVSAPWIRTASSSFRLLRVLCLRYSLLEVVPEAVAGLFNLYYLDMSRTKVKKIPGSVAKLKNLQTLHLRFARVRSLPREVTTLTSLRHLSVSNDLFGTSIPGNICGLKCLQTLREVKASKDVVRNLGYLTQLRSLGITGVLTNYNEDLWTSIRKMTTLSKLAVATRDDNEVLNLEKLKPLRNLEKFYLTGKLADGAFAPICCGFQKLKLLSMRWSGIAQDPLSILSQMPNLVYLNLYCAYNGEILSFCSGWFPRLTHLYLGKLDHLKSMEIEDGAMKKLAYLELRELWNFRVIPEGFSYLSSLQHLYARNMPGDFVEGLQGNGQIFVQHVANIECV